MEHDEGYQKQVFELFEEIKPALDRLREHGITVAAFAHVYDPMTKLPYTFWDVEGDYLAIMGVLKEWEWSKRSQYMWCYGDDEASD